MIAPRTDHATDVAAVQRMNMVPTILEAICRLTGMGFAAVARVTDDRWVACAVLDGIDFGLEPGGELEVATTLCTDVRHYKTAVMIEHASIDPVYAHHPTPQRYGFESYVSMPIMLPDGSVFGTLCAIDPQPRELSSPDVRRAFTLFADLIGFQLEADRQLESSRADLIAERDTAKLREQFIAVLGHDLRNPIASIDAGARLLADEDLSDRGLAILTLMQASVRRMAGMVDNILDFARGRLGGGIALTITPVTIEPVVRHVVAELIASHPDRVIHIHVACPAPVPCDAPRIAQMLSNLVGNALTHGAPDVPIQVTAIAHETAFELSVSNGGEEIPPTARDRLFAPFERGAVGADREGLGLGLYIASQIAAAHGGTLSVASSPEETQFAFRMPLS